MTASCNHVVLMGRCSQYGPKITWTEHAKPHTSLTLICEEPGRDGKAFRTFIPVVCVGGRAESVAESVEPDDLLLIDGRLSWKAGTGKTKDGRLVVVCFDVTLIQKAPALSAMAGEG